MSLPAARRRMVDAMDDGGLWPPDSPWVRQAVLRTPRDRYAPAAVRVWDGHAAVYTTVDRDRDPSAWADAVYPDPYDATVIDVVDGFAASSISCVSVVADMLDSLVVEPGHRVLELGTGSGWNAALLAARAGDGLVTSVEVEPGLAGAARDRLDGRAEVVLGDGAVGWPDGAPYDRLVSTYAVDEVPWAWVEQVRPGGRIVVPWGRLGHVALTVAEDGRSATGWMQGLAAFMPARGTDQGQTFSQVQAAAPDFVESATEWDSTPLHLDGNTLFAVRVLLPEVRVTTEQRDGSGGIVARLHDGRASWAVMNGARTRQGGSRRLADEVREAWRRWQDAGAPSVYEFGLTRTPHGQHLWGPDGRM